MNHDMCMNMCIYVYIYLYTDVWLYDIVYV